MAKGLRSNRDSITTRQIAQPATGPAPDSSAPTGTVPLASVTNADDLKAIEALAGTAGLLAKTAANTWALRTLTGPAAGLSVSNGDGAAGNPTLALANDLAALEGLAGTGYARRTGSDAWTLDATIPWASISSTPTTLAGYGITDAQPLDSDLTAIAALTTAAGGRGLLTLAGTANRLAGFDGSGNASLITISTGLALAAAALGLDVNALSEDTTPDQDADFDVAYDTSASAHRKRKAANFFRVESFTPTFTFATPGDLSVSYATQFGRAFKIGRLVVFFFRLVCTPTYTTASGDARFAGLPYTSDTAGNTQQCIGNVGNAITFPAGTTQLNGFVAANTTYMSIFGVGTGTAPAVLSTAAFPTATSRTINGQGFYWTA